MATARLEDEFSDIIGKASRGLRVPLPVLDAGNRAEILRVAAALKLDGAKLAGIALDGWTPTPKDTGHWGHIAMISSDYGGGIVNCYLQWDDDRTAALFDTGVDGDAVLRVIAREKLNLAGIFITHGHHDHIEALPEIQRQHSHAKVRQEGASVGRLAISAAKTPGHSADGVTYIVGLVAYVGDSLFAGSVGGANHSYDGLLRNVRQHILSLPDETLLCPGHGPMTTVAEEKAHNPFFP